MGAFGSLSISKPRYDYSSTSWQSVFRPRWYTASAISVWFGFRLGCATAPTTIVLRSFSITLPVYDAVPSSAHIDIAEAEQYGCCCYSHLCFDNRYLPQIHLHIFLCPILISDDKTRWHFFHYTEEGLHSQIITGVLTSGWWFLLVFRRSRLQDTLEAFSPRWNSLPHAQYCSANCSRLGPCSLFQRERLSLWRATSRIGGRSASTGWLVRRSRSRGASHWAWATPSRIVVGLCFQIDRQLIPSYDNRHIPCWLHWT